MPAFSNSSLQRLDTCCPDLQRLFKEVVKHFDCTILEGHRGRAAQHKAFVTGKSKLDWPKGNHNAMPSKAVDVAPYPIDWNDIHRFYHFAGYVLGVATQIGLSIRWGGDWDMDHQLKDETFRDLVHFEIHQPPNP